VIAKQFSLPRIICRNFYELPVPGEFFCYCKKTRAEIDIPALLNPISYEKPVL